MKRILLLSTFLLRLASAQERTIGDRLPDVPLNNVINSTGATATGSYKGKPLLLSFWGTDCSDGTKVVAQLDSLQKAWGTTAHVLVVTSETEGEVRSVLQDKTLLAGIALPVVTGDTVLSRYFPHRTAPHLLWVGAAGTVQAITGPAQLTAANLTAFRNGMGLHLPVKTESRDPAVFFSLTPLMKNDYEQTKNTRLAYSYLGDYRPGIATQASLPYYDFNANNTRMLIINHPLAHLYKLAYGRLKGFHRKQVVLKGFENAVSEKRYCYDLELADSVPAKAYQYMRTDLDRFFDATSRLEKGKIAVLVLRRTGAIDLTKTTAKDSRKREEFEKEGVLYLRNIPLAFKVGVWNSNGAFALPVVDETGYKGSVDLELPADFSNLEAVRKALQLKGLDLVPGEREMEVIMVKKGTK